jgi:hypothetical protein
MQKKMTEEKLREAVAGSISVAEVLKKLTMSITTNNYKSFHQNVRLYNIDTSHFRGQSHLLGKINNIKTTIPLEKILIENSTYLGIAKLKIRLIKEGLLKYECYGDDCGISTWKGKKISLQLDHINGIHNDHRIENLRLLCPNCHSQTETFCGRNIKETDESKQQKLCKCGAIKLKESETCRKCAATKREKINWPTDDDLLTMVKWQGYSGVAKKLGVSRTSIKKRIIHLPNYHTYQ